MTLDRSDGSATLELYRAALGPVHTDYYLRAFTRMDAATRPGTGWNWAAALLTLNWLLFRQLWIAALAYAGAVAATLLLLFGIGRLVFQLTADAQWALLAVCALLAVAIPGAYGNRWFYAACNKKMERALVASATLTEACAVLSRRASGRKHLGGLLAGNLLLCGLAAVLVLGGSKASTAPTASALQASPATVLEPQPSGLAKHSLAALPTEAGSGTPAAAAPASAPGAAAFAPAATASVPAPAASAATPSASVSTTAAGGAIEPLSAAQVSRSSQGRVQALTTAPVAAAPAPFASATPPAAPAASASLVNAAVPPVAATPAKPVSDASAPSARGKKPKTAKPAVKPATHAAKAPAHAAVARTAAPAAASATVPAAEEKFLINVGLFADANNARNAYTKLQDAGLPALSQEVASKKGPRTRVRVGPFESRAEAERVADKIRALQLDAAVFKP